MLNIVSKISLFLSSYAPLWLIFTILNIRSQPWLAIAFAVMLVLSIITTLAILSVSNRQHGERLKIVSSRSGDAETMSYIASYLIPFASTSFDRPEQTISLLVFVVILAIVYVNSGMLYVNPILSLARFRIFDIELENGKVYKLVSRNRPEAEHSFDAVRLGPELYWEKPIGR